MFFCCHWFNVNPISVCPNIKKGYFFMEYVYFYTALYVHMFKLNKRIKCRQKQSFSLLGWNVKFNAKTMH